MEIHLMRSAKRWMLAGMADHQRDAPGDQDADEAAAQISFYDKVPAAPPDKDIHRPQRQHKHCNGEDYRKVHAQGVPVYDGNGSDDQGCDQRGSVEGHLELFFDGEGWSHGPNVYFFSTGGQGFPNLRAEMAIFLSERDVGLFRNLVV